MIKSKFSKNQTFYRPNFINFQKQCGKNKYDTTYTVSIICTTNFSITSSYFSRSVGINLRSGYHPPHHAHSSSSITYPIICTEETPPIPSLFDGTELSSQTEYKYSGTDVIYVTKSIIKLILFGPIPLGKTITYYVKDSKNLYIEESEICTLTFLV